MQLRDHMTKGLTNLGDDQWAVFGLHGVKASRCGQPLRDGAALGASVTQLDAADERVTHVDREFQPGTYAACSEDARDLVASHMQFVGDQVERLTKRRQIAELGDNRGYGGIDHDQVRTTSPRTQQMRRWRIAGSSPTTGASPEVIHEC